jgi:hypothetical protein
MDNMLVLFILAIFFSNAVLMLSWGIRIGKAMQKDIPPPPLAKPTKKAVKAVGRAFKLLRLKGKLFLVKKAPKGEENFWD